MTTAAVTLQSPTNESAVAASWSWIARVYLTEAKYEFRKQIRIPAFMIPTIGFPIMFYVLFGLLIHFGPSDSQLLATYTLATYGAFGVISIALFALGVGVAVERGQGWLAVKRASPMPLPAYFTAKYVTTVAISVILMILMCAIGAIFGHVRLSAGHWIGLVVVEALGAIPFCAMGLAVGYLAGPNSAAAVVNIIYLPMAFLSGLFIPVEMLPRFLQGFAVALPPYHLARLALEVVGVEPASHALVHVAALIGFCALFTLIAFVAYRRDEGKTYG